VNGDEKWWKKKVSDDEGRRNEGMEEPQLDEEEKARLARLEAVWKLKHHPLKHYFVIG
jgi:hypothetical protein